MILGFARWPPRASELKKLGIVLCQVHNFSSLKTRQLGTAFGATLDSERHFEFSEVSFFHDI